MQHKEQKVSDGHTLVPLGCLVLQRHAAIQLLLLEPAQKQVKSTSDIDREREHKRNEGEVLEEYGKKI